MISNQILQNTIEGLKAISRIDFSVLDTEGKALAATFEDTKDYESAVLSFVESPADSQVIQGDHFFKISMNSSWNMFCWPAVRTRKYTWSARLRRFRFRACW